MKTPIGIKKEKISHLQDCLEKLLFRENSNNETDVERVYAYIYKVIWEMEEMNAMDALVCFRIKINDEVRKELLKYNIELVV